MRYSSGYYYHSTDEEIDDMRVASSETAFLRLEVRVNISAISD